MSSEISSFQSDQSRVSLLDLSKQLPFVIDDAMKEKLVFAETLIVSCAHYETPHKEEDSDNESQPEASSEWSCSFSKSNPTDTETPEPYEIPPIEEDVPLEEESEDEDEHGDFHFYFFPDCQKPLPPANSRQSLIVGSDGIPVMNLAAKEDTLCTCPETKKDKCECFPLAPCSCGATKKSECRCGKLKQICICDEHKPSKKCTCFKEPCICTCFPGLPKPVCECKDVVKPCICKINPCPVCECKFKPHFLPDAGIPDFDYEGYAKYLTAHGEEEENKTVTTVTSGDFVCIDEERKKEKIVNRLNSGLLSSNDYKKLEHVQEEEPCDCQKPDPEPIICKCDSRFRDINKECDCILEEETRREMKRDPLKSICECPSPRVCKCEAGEDGCKCFADIKTCTCGDPEDCRCHRECDCIGPCICDTKKPDECICMDRAKQIQAGLVCTCTRKNPEKLKKVRAGKEGYRWCHDIDPYHTFFDYAYGLHDKIDYREQEKEKFKILGLYDEAQDVCPVHGKEKLPKFEKKVFKPSLDCCSSVGGITISVDTIGETKNEFIVQVVSHASKEGAQTGSKLVSIIDTNLHTIEENRSEYHKKKDTTKRRKSYMAVCDAVYYNKVTRICNDKEVTKRIYHPFEKAKRFLLEGSNVILLRYFALRRYKGSVKTETVTIDGVVCESIYICPGVSQALVNGKPLFVVKVERHLIAPNGVIHQTLTVLSLRGYMISHEWSNSSYVLHINPLLKINSEKDEIEDHEPKREKWREDLQLFSDFLNYKSKRNYEGARYVSEHGKLSSMIRDYLTSILLLKPQDVIPFTRHFFRSGMSSIDLPNDEYFQPGPGHVKYYYMED